MKVGLELIPFEILSLEFVYSAVILFICFLIYFKTREIYELTKHKGIYYFRNTFLFLGISYFFRFLILSFAISGRIMEFSIFPEHLIVILTSFFLVAYFSSLAIFSLIYSMVWRRIEGGLLEKRYSIHLIALVISLIVFAFRSHVLLLILQTGLLLLLVIVAYMNFKLKDKKRPFSQIYFIYFLLILFWIINLSALVKFPCLELRILIYALSTGIMAYIAYKVVRRLS